MGMIEKFEEEGGTPCCVKCQSHIRGISGYLGSLAIRFSDIPTKKAKVTRIEELGGADVSHEVAVSCWIMKVTVEK